MTERLLGLDSGGTKTIAAMADAAGNVLGVSTGSGLDPTANANWEAQLTRMLRPLEGVTSAVLGLPFHGEVPEISAQQQAFARRHLGEAALVMNDVAVAFEGAFAGKDGVLILAGTGSMAWARGPAGEVRTGGWGDLFGDEGSAFWIGREALGMVSRHLDGRGSLPDFADGILGRIGIAGTGLIGWAYRNARPRVEIASIAAHVSVLAVSGNPAARDLLQRAALHLAEAGRAAGRACGLGPVPKWSSAGGVFGDPIIRKGVAEAIGRGPDAALLPPVGGAILVAARRAGLDGDDRFVDRLNRSLAEASA